jgi:hypothetical protein
MHMIEISLTPKPNADVLALASRTRKTIRAAATRGRKPWIRQTAPAATPPARKGKGSPAWLP